jgi:hypothetical protein
MELSQLAIKNILPVIAGLLIVVFILSNSRLPRKSEVVYNCSLAEISPDFPIEIKEGCRKLRMDKINENRISK